MSLNPFRTVENYSEMLVKIGIFNSIAGIISILFLGKHIPQVGDFLSLFNSSIEVGGYSIGIIAFLIPIIFAILSRIIKLHDKISGLLRIRLHYDVNYIIKPILTETNPDKTNQIEFLRKNREKIMNKIFYKYASAKPEKCQIEHHTVIMALDQFSWYWILIEVLAVLIISVATVIIFKAWSLLTPYLIIMLILLISNYFILKLCKKYTSKEVEQILDSRTRQSEIKTTIDEI